MLSTMERSAVALGCIILMTSMSLGLGKTTAVDRECQQKAADVVFLLDSSFSLWEEDFQQQLSFVNDVVKAFAIGSNNIRVGVATFSTDVNLEFHLNHHSSHEELQKAIMNIQYHKTGGTNTAAAIKFARETMFSTTHGSRPWAAHIVVLITDGHSVDPPATAHEAALAHAQGVELFAIGVNQADEKELGDVASDPQDKHVFMVDNYGALSGLVAAVTARACYNPVLGDQTPEDMNKNRTEEKPQDCSKRPVDVYFALDASSSIWYPEFLQQLDFVKALVAKFPIGNGRTHVGALVYSDDVYPRVALSGNHNLQDLQHRIDALPYITGGTNTAGVLEYLMQTGFSPQVARKDAAHVVILITDGQSSNLTRTRLAARAAHEAGMHVFAVGVGRHTDDQELMTLASDPDQHYVFHVDNFKSLNDILDLLATKACQVPNQKVPQKDEAEQSCSQHPMDLLFLYDAASLSRHQKGLVDKLLTMTAEGLSAVHADNVRVGLMRHPSPGGGDISLAERLHPSDFRHKVATSHPPGLHPIIKRMRRYGFLPVHGGRSGVRRVAVMVVGGPLGNAHLAEVEARRAKYIGVVVYAVLIGHHEHHAHVRNMVTHPSEKHILQVPDFPALLQVSRDLDDMICRG